MPRIIAGLFKGLALATPDDPLARPTAGLVRGALFSILGPKAQGASVLDLFAGSGAMGLEALSRGAARVLMCDRSPQAIAALSANLKRVIPALRPLARILRASFPRDYGALSAHGPFSLFLLDPPYQAPMEDVLSFMALAASNGLASPGATLVWEQAPATLRLWDHEAQGPWRVTLARAWGRRAAAVLELGLG
jgi:16S rRNA (guanine966-N2)-methyltransferase